MILTETILQENIPLIHSAYSSYEQGVLKRNKLIYMCSQSRRFDIFLSHSYLDKKLVYSLVDMFNNAGYSVYVDWMVDAELDRTQVNKLTSETLRKRMKECCSLAYVATSNIAKSKWCPWELGFVDGNKNGRCAILPIFKQETAFKGQEYLGLYPYIDYCKINSTKKYEFRVNDPEDPRKFVKLRDWLDGKNPQIK